MEKDTFTDFWSEIREIISSLSEKWDGRWRKRERVLSTKLLVAFIFKLIMNRNKQGYGSTLFQFWETCLEQGVALPQDTPVSASSLCEARQKLPEDFFIELHFALFKHWEEKHTSATWKGYRLFAVDGSRINLPRELLSFGYNLYDKERRYYPQGLLSCLYNLQDQTVYNFNFVKHMNERACALDHIKKLTNKDIIIFDRGYFSYHLLYCIVEQGVQAIFRLQEGGANKQIVDFWNSLQEDTIIDYYPSPPVISDLKKRGIHLEVKPIPLRLIKHKIGGEVYIYGTTLIGEDYPKSCFAELYHGRWGIEELYKISKQIIEIEDFHAKTERGIKQELYVHLLLINLARFLEIQSQHFIPPHKTSLESDKFKKMLEIGIISFTAFKINFKNCLLVVSRYLEKLILNTETLLISWLQRIMKAIARVRQKIRPGRTYPRISHKPRTGRGKWPTRNSSLNPA